MSGAFAAFTAFMALGGTVVPSRGGSSTASSAGLAEYSVSH